MHNCCRSVRQCAKSPAPMRMRYLYAAGIACTQRRNSRARACCSDLLRTTGFGRTRDAASVGAWASGAQAPSNTQQGRVRLQPVRDSASQRRERPGSRAARAPARWRAFCRQGTAPRSLPAACYTPVARHDEQIEGEKLLGLPLIGTRSSRRSRYRQHANQRLRRNRLPSKPTVCGTVLDW